VASGRSKPKRAKCYVVNKDGAKKQTPCAAPAKKKTVTSTKSPSAPPAAAAGVAPATPSSGISVRALTGG